jgi:hypothetical protein
MGLAVFGLKMAALFSHEGTRGLDGTESSDQALVDGEGICTLTAFASALQAGRLTRAQPIRRSGATYRT